ncbi:spore germination protein GerPC [Paenibacillus kobensis]|uniref:spore germination protein GerPC n=1 Tax=Paenibacillus kobensis TaxID=59841 RepID=UPI000FD917F5|nr:spore germination protein GerPC [Paenibacillus kobensis]
MTSSNNSGIPPASQPPQSSESRPQQAASGWPGWPAWVAQVQNALRLQQEQIMMLQKRVDMLSAQLKSAEAKPTYSIDKIEYHFDQLKIEKLDGTLNIGIQPPADGSESNIDQLIVQQAKNGHGIGITGDGSGDGNNVVGSGTSGTPNVFPSAGPAATNLPPPFDNIQRRVNQYMEQQGAEALASLEQEIGLPLDPYHRRIVIEDIRRQLPTRIQFYMQQMKTNNPDSDTQPFTVEEQVTGKTIRDIQMAFRQYLMKLSTNGSGPEGGGILQA